MHFINTPFEIVDSSLPPLSIILISLISNNFHPLIFMSIAGYLTVITKIQPNSLWIRPRLATTLCLSNFIF